MKKLVLLFLSVLGTGMFFQSCSNSKTYADMLAEERAAIKDFIKTNNIEIISLSEFEKDTLTRCPENGHPGKNEYVEFSNGVYMQIVRRGEGDTLKSRDEVLVRFLEYDILEKQQTVANYDVDGWADSFVYQFDDYTAQGMFVDYSSIAYYYGTGETAVPTGWLMPLRYIKDRAHVKLIVPSKAGHSTATQYVYPFFYDIRKFQIW